MHIPVVKGLVPVLGGQLLAAKKYQAHLIMDPLFFSSTTAPAVSSSFASSSSIIMMKMKMKIPLLLLVRGGGAGSGVDLERIGLRLASINSYAIVTALLLSATLRLYASTPKDLNGTRTVENIVKYIFVVSTAMSIICGAYTTVVFSLLSLYSKTALGLGQDVAFQTFFAGTEISRQRAFQSFLMALFSFEVCFASSLFINYDGKTRWWAAGLASLMVFLSWCHWKTLMDVAAKLLF